MFRKFKKLILIRLFLILILVELFHTCDSIAQNDFSSIIKYRNSIDQEFKDSAKSPLEKKDIVNFKGLDNFEIDANFCVKAFFKRTPYEIPFTMMTTTTRNPPYIKYGELSFVLKGEEFKLNLYQNIDKNGKSRNDSILFLPFTDETNGTLTYGGGRYIDISIPLYDTIVLDFNKAYNPYCAYNNKYSCPIPPKENHLKIEIKAGVKTYNKKNDI